MESIFQAPLLILIIRFFYQKNNGLKGKILFKMIMDGIIKIYKKRGFGKLTKNEKCVRIYKMNKGVRLG